LGTASKSLSFQRSADKRAGLDGFGLILDEHVPFDHADTASFDPGMRSHVA